MILVTKPIYLKPFIFVYKVVAFIVQIPVKLINYFSMGLFFVLYFLIDIVMSILYSFAKYIIYGFVYISKFVYFIIKYTLNGLKFVCYCVYRFIRYTLLGVVAPFIFGSRYLAAVNRNNERLRAKREAEAERRELARKRNKQIEEENKKRLAEIRKNEKTAKSNRRDEIKEKSKADIYINENVTLEKKKLSDRINDGFMAIGNIPKKIKSGLKNWYSGLSFVKNSNNQKDINREALLINFEGDDAEKSDVKIMYKYVAKSPEGKIIKGFFPAFSKVEVHSFLLSEGNEVYSIETNKWIQQTHSISKTGEKKKIKIKDLIFFLTQLSTYIKAGIPLVESLKILTRQYKSKDYQRIFRAMIYDLTMGDNFSDALAKQGNAFPRLLINMVKASELTGELPEALDDMAEYFTETDKTRKQMITAMMYPAIIFVVAVAAVVFIMVYVVPQFVGIYSGIEGSQLPAITVFVMNVSSFLQKQWMWLVLGVVITIVVIAYLYKNVKAFKSLIQWILMHIPVIGQVIIYNEVTMFTKTFASLLSHNVFITDSMEILNKITGNEIYKMLILDTITNLAKGEKISLAFQDHWAFPVPAYEMIVTGEKTGQLPEMMDKVSKYYQELHRNAVTRIKTFVEPILILFLTVVVGGVVLSIVIPMFSIYSAVQM